MASSSAIFILLSLLAAALPSHALLPNQITGQVLILGRVLCTLDGNAVEGSLGQPVFGANVTLSCNGGQTTLSQVFTDPAGFYVVLLNLADGVAFDESECEIFIELPAGNCTVLPPTGSLRAPVSIISTVSGVLGWVTVAVAGLYEYVLGA